MEADIQDDDLFGDYAFGMQEYVQFPLLFTVPLREDKFFLKC